ncbi:MAG: ASKHA domain-containing protein, partial [Candidatus Bipolaricaulota bacterium]|nr:ASKHA domain-containing protein [Candidatus Bipolaricaulota bacterium]
SDFFKCQREECRYRACKMLEVLGVVGLYLLGNPAINSIWPWLLAVTIYGIGKTFYWPTLLGVISERFPKGGALALGLSGGIGMISAGILGGPGIGYKQDYFAVSYLQETPERQQTYERYKARTESGQPDLKGFPILSSLFPQVAPKVAGIDNARLKVFQDYAAILDENGKPRPQQKTTLESDLETIETLKRQGRPVEPKLEENLRKLYQWWLEEGLPYYSQDQNILPQARLHGAKMALLSREAWAKCEEIAQSATYYDLISFPHYYEEFLAAKFLPHTELERFPSVQERLARNLSSDLTPRPPSRPHPDPLRLRRGNG